MPTLVDVTLVNVTEAGPNSGWAGREQHVSIGTRDLHVDGHLRSYAETDIDGALHIFADCCAADGDVRRGDGGGDALILRRRAEAVGGAIPPAATLGAADAEGRHPELPAAGMSSSRWSRWD